MILLNYSTKTYVMHNQNNLEVFNIYVNLQKKFYFMFPFGEFMVSSNYKSDASLNSSPISLPYSSKIYRFVLFNFFGIIWNADS